MKLNVLLLGSGGREHAMAWSINKSALLDTLYVAPGNPGTAQIAQNVALSLNDFDEIESFITSNNIDLTVVGPEKPLVEGITDYLQEKGHNVFGPSKAAAQLEGSKHFANQFMKENMIPTANYAAFGRDEFESVLPYIKKKNDYPVVLKADGLAGGKGVFICETEQEAEDCLHELKENEKFSSAAKKLVVEDFLEGEEASVFVVSDGTSAKIIHNAQDHKRVNDGGTGLNTGGMGAYCPAPVLNKEQMHRVEKEIILPTISAMVLDEKSYKGILYCGLMITEGGPKVIEYNCRLGDPECQAVLPTLKSDFLELLWATAEGKLDDYDITLDHQYRCCVVMASGGYPQSYETGKEITGLDEISDEALIFQAGTKQKNGTLFTDGGRVLSVVCSGETLEDAIRSTYREVEKISFQDMHYRTDIGTKGLAYF